MPDNHKNDAYRQKKGYDANVEVIKEECIRLGVVNFLNATPLIEGLEGVDDVELVPRVPSDLIGCLERREVDIALASSIDYQKSDVDLGILPVGVLSSDGNSLTVQLCSRIPFQNVTSVYCDSDSHTSVALLQLVIDHKYGNAIEIVPTDLRSLQKCNHDWPETVLIIGDKVVTSHCQKEYTYTLDLGEAWKEQTGLPFVFAMWQGLTSCSKSKIETVSMLLHGQRLLNKQRIEQVVSANATSCGWEPAVALQYVTSNMCYDFTESHQQSLELFYSLAKAAQITENNRPVQILSL